jgi:cytochrome c553
VKKSVLFLVVLVLIAGLFISACGSNNTATTADDAATTTTEAADETRTELEQIHNRPAGWSATANCSQCHGDGRTAQDY